MFSWKKAVLASILLLLDGVILLGLSVLLMDYDDSYTGPPTEYGTWHTMTPVQRGIAAGHSLWVGANVLALLLLGYWVVKGRAQRSASN